MSCNNKLIAIEIMELINLNMNPQSGRSLDSPADFYNPNKNILVDFSRSFDYESNRKNFVID